MLRSWRLPTAVCSQVFAERDTAKILRDIICGLNMVQAGGIVHRDLKPQNILLDRGMRYAITGFGIAIRGNYLQPGKREGTEQYMASQWLLDCHMARR